MATAKNRRTKKTSKGLRSSISNSVIRLMRANAHPADKFLNKVEAWMAGKRGYVTIENPNKEDTSRRFIKVSFDKYFGGSYKNIKNRIKRSDDVNSVEI